MSTPRKPLGEAEFNQLFHTYHKPVFLYLRTLLARRGHPPDPHLVEDLTQEAFTVLWEKQESFLASPNPIGWLYVTAANLARNHLRTQQRWAACLAQVDPEFLEAQPDPRPLEAGLLNLEGGEPDQGQVPKKFPGFGTFFAGWMQGIPSPRT